MTRKQKVWRVIVVCLLVIAAISAYPLAYLIKNVAICFNPFDAGGCIAIVYDKAAMRAADRVVLCVGEDRYEITDADFVDDITDELMVASRSGLRFAEIDRWIEIYDGDTLVRRILWAECTDAKGVFIYYEDKLHPVYQDEHLEYTEDGQIIPSDELVEKLNAIIVAANNPAK